MQYEGLHRQNHSVPQLKCQDRSRDFHHRCRLCDSIRQSSTDASKQEQRMEQDEDPEHTSSEETLPDGYPQSKIARK